MILRLIVLITCQLCLVGSVMFVTGLSVLWNSAKAPNEPVLSEWLRVSCASCVWFRVCFYFYLLATLESSAASVDLFNHFRDFLWPLSMNMCHLDRLVGSPAIVWIAFGVIYSSSIVGLIYFKWRVSWIPPNDFSHYWQDRPSWPPLLFCFLLVYLRFGRFNLAMKSMLQKPNPQKSTSMAICSLSIKTLPNYLGVYGLPRWYLELQGSPFLHPITLETFARVLQALTCLSGRIRHYS